MGGRRRRPRRRAAAGARDQRCSAACPLPAASAARAGSAITCSASTDIHSINNNTNWQRELGWALEDAVGGYCEAAGGAWRPAAWQQLQAEAALAQRRAASGGGGAGGAGGGAAAFAGWQVQLRAPLAELRELWRLRLEVRRCRIVQAAVSDHLET